jgi:hypothetical protein
MLALARYSVGPVKPIITLSVKINAEGVKLYLRFLLRLVGFTTGKFVNSPHKNLLIRAR